MLNFLVYWSLILICFIKEIVVNRYLVMNNIIGILCVIIFYLEWEIGN